MRIWGYGREAAIDPHKGTVKPLPGMTGPPSRGHYTKRKKLYASAPGDCAKSKMVKVHNSKGIANQTGPESCVAHREVRDEALTGEPAGQPLSRESFKLVQGADAVSVAEGNMDRRDSASACSTLRGLRTWHAGTLFAREPGDLLLGRFRCCGAVRVGETRSRSR